MLSLGIVGGTTIRIIADGADEQAAVDGLVKLVSSGFASNFCNYVSGGASPPLFSSYTLF